MTEEILEIATADGAMGVITARPSTEGRLPVVILFHDGPGIREATHEVVRRIADWGFYAVAPDRYYRYGRFVSVKPEDLRDAAPDSELMQRFFGMVTATTDELIRADMEKLLEHLASDPHADPGPMFCIGYCNGVRTLLRVMTEYPGRFAAGAGLHPSFCVSEEDDSPHRSAAQIGGTIYIAIGASDHLASVEHNQPLLDELAKLGDCATVEVLPGADHGFAMPGPSYHPEAASRAYEMVRRLFTGRKLPAGLHQPG